MQHRGDDERGLLIKQGAAEAVWTAGAKLAQLVGTLLMKHTCRSLYTVQLVHRWQKPAQLAGTAVTAWTDCITSAISFQVKKISSVLEQAASVHIQCWRKQL